MGNQAELSQALFFTGERQLSVQQLSLPALQAGEVRVQTSLSAVSAGTELLLYRNQLPATLPLDSELAGMSDPAQYPVQYGYACVGRVVQIHPTVSQQWQNQLVFTFHPHQTAFNMPANQLIPIPDGVSPANALFLPNMETAVGLVMDGQPMIGERLILFGQGVVGLLLTAILQQFPLDLLLAIDNFALRRDWAEKLGANAGISPDQLNDTYAKTQADLCYELSGNPNALNDAIRHTIYSGRVVIGSWYGNKKAHIDLGGVFHRNQIRLVSSQVSQIHPKWRGRWDKNRRFQVAWQQIQRIQPAQLITHRFPFADASQLYQLLDQTPQETVQTIFEYEN